MKNLFIYSGIALVVLANIDHTLFEVKIGEEVSQKSKNEVLANKVLKSEITNISDFKKVAIVKNDTQLNSKTIVLRNFTKKMVNTNGTDEPIEVASFKMEKTAEELIAEDNLITENNLSNETQVLDFNLINSLSVDYEVVESVNSIKSEKTADELIAEDNLVTENNLSNENQVLDFNLINSLYVDYEVVEPVNSIKLEKTADELIAEDNLITENNLSNETQALDFELINKISKSRN